MKFYTGVDAKAFQFIIDLMGAVWSACRHTIMDTTNFEGLCRCGRKRYLKPEDELLLTLCKAHHNFPEEDLGKRFRIDQSTVSRIFTSWIEAMDACISEVDISPEKATIQKLMPSDFKEKYSTTRAIIDGAEIEIERCKNRPV